MASQPLFHSEPVSSVFPAFSWLKLTRGKGSHSASLLPPRALDFSGPDRLLERLRALSALRGKRFISAPLSKMNSLKKGLGFSTFLEGLSVLC